MQALAREIACLPVQLWSFLLNHDGGWVIVHPGRSRYVVGPVSVAGFDRHNVALISVEDLARGDDLVLHVLGHLVDHYLGCAGDPAGAWLSEGGGIEPHWREAGERLGRLFALGHAVDEAAAASVKEYVARSLAWYCHRPHDLNVADPNIWKWFRATLWNDRFWRTPVPRGRAHERRT
ncbi:MAG: hypothetical protein JXA93_23795 [Anaerolineae bacterium]|nr:hypothetical protein [Anaerolineae bacterium]